MKKSDLQCPNCSVDVAKSYDDSVKLRVKLLKWTRDGMFAICKACGHDVPIKVDFIKSVQSKLVYEVDSNQK